jgi:lysozyme family protein
VQIATDWNTMTIFEIYFDRLLGNEGGYVNSALDPGGETNWGISKRQYPNLNIKTLTRDAAKVIYLTDFWQAANMDAFDAAISWQVFDAAVNHGIANATRMLQKAAGVADDGHIGPITIAAVKVRKPVYIVVRFIAARIRFWKLLSTWATFGKGWMERAAADLDFAAVDL